MIAPKRQAEPRFALNPPLAAAPKILQHPIMPQTPPNELFLKREVQENSLVEQYIVLLDNWSDKIPFSPIKKLGSKTKFVSATENAAYKTSVVSQIEERWLEDHEVPYRDQALPDQFRPGAQFDPWKMNFPQFADFAQHHHSTDLPSTRRIYDCSRCSGSGEITCDSCSGSGKITCSSCSGRGQNRKTRDIPYVAVCTSCNGTGGHGKDANRIRCSSCGGGGQVNKTRTEEYYVPCGRCAASGKVTCFKCGGSGKITCHRCDGARRLMAYVTAEQKEEPARGERQYIPTGLPQFQKKENPLSVLDGDSVFTQDEQTRIAAFAFDDQQAASLLTTEVEKCREDHKGHVLRQKINVERCSIVEYHYQHDGKPFSIWLNPKHVLVEDLAGPIQTAIENMDALAKKAFDEKRYEDAYRLALRSLCMDEATSEEKRILSKSGRRLCTHYAFFSLVSFLAVWATWIAATTIVMARSVEDTFYNSFSIFSVCLLASVTAAISFARFRGLTLHRASRVPAAFSIGGAAALAGAGSLFRWGQLSPLDWGTDTASFLGALCVLPVIVFCVVLLRDHAACASRKKQILKISSRTCEAIEDVQAVESLIISLEPKPERTKKIIKFLALWVVGFFVCSTVVSLICVWREREGIAKRVAVAKVQAETDKENRRRSAAGEAWVVESVGVKMVPIAAGSFTMGSTNGSKDEQPLTQVTLTRPYWLGATEVTQGQWEAIMGNNPSNFKGVNLPVDSVSYEDALAFCRKLTERERAAGRLPAGYEYSLPTEAQWEYACRAGTKGDYAGDYAGNLDAMGWYDGNSGKKTHEVGGKQANAWGVYDMHGNVWEWCLDWYGDYAGGTMTDPRGASSGSYRVLRGGCWGNVAAGCRSAYRFRYSPGARYAHLGFRLALSSAP